MFPKFTTLFYPIFFGHGSTSMYINCKGGGRGQGMAGEEGREA
jgi:hypothetical protein